MPLVMGEGTETEGRVTGVGTCRPVAACNNTCGIGRSFPYTCDCPAAGARSHRQMDLLGFCIFYM